MRYRIPLLLILTCLSSAGARLYSPRVVSPHTADTYSLKTFAQFPRWRGLKGDALAWEVYKYLADTRTGLFHMNEVLEGTDPLNEDRTVRDPVKIINVYGYAYCYILGPVMAGISEGIGLGPARTLSLPDWKHVTAEAFYDERWHYLDIDVRAVFRRPDRSLASMHDAQTDPSLWTGRGPLFFPNDPLDRTRNIYRNTAVLYYHDFYSSGHTMDYVLRQGETFTRWWTPQGGRWNHPPEYNRSEWLCRLLEQQPRGPKPNHRHFSIHNHGNGRFVYCPDLTNGSSDFQDGVYDAANVQTSAGGLTLTERGDGVAIFEVRSPYVIVPIVGKLDTADDDREASVIEIDGSNIRLSLSQDNGLTWQDLQDLQAVSGKTTLDLTRFVSGRYGYLLRIQFHGEPGRSVVRSLKMTTWVQVAPASLPQLRPGTNRMRFVTGDHYGLPTRVVELSSDASRRQELLKYLIDQPTDYDPERRTSRVRGTSTARLNAPPHTHIAWFSAGASFRTHQGANAAQTRNSIAYAVDRPQGFQTIYRAEVPSYCNHWHYNADGEVRLDTPARCLFVRYTGDPALNNIRIYAHCLDDTPATTSPAMVTHVWKDKGITRTQQFRIGAGDEYDVHAGPECEDVSVEIAVPSQ